MAQLNQLILTATGLYTYSNTFSEETAPEGSLAVGRNIVIDKDGIMSPRRGYEQLISSAGRNTRLAIYQNYLVAHDSTTGTLRGYDGVVNDAVSPALLWTLTGINKPTSAVSMKFAQASKNLYFTSSQGVQKIDAAATMPTVYDAGVAPAVGFETQLTGPGTALPAASAGTHSVRANYRVVWGRKDGNDNLLLGAPSALQEVVNTDTANGKDVQFRIYIPKRITTADFFVRIYRTVTVDSINTSPIDAGDDMRLTTEVPLTAGMLSAGYVNFAEAQDITPDALLTGAALYTNDTQEGIAQANLQPPQCVDLAFYQNHMFYGNTQQPYNYVLTLISVDTANGLRTNDKVLVQYGSVTVTYTGDSGLGTPWDLVNPTNHTVPRKFKISSDPNPFIAIEETAKNLVAVINADSQTTQTDAFYALYDVGPNDPPGRIKILETDFGSATGFTVKIQYTGYSTTGDTSGRITTTFNPTMAHNTAYSSSNEAFPNRIYYSKIQEPEAVPGFNYFDVGSTDEVIQRLITTKNSLIIMTDRSIWAITGSDVNTFSPTLLDNTTRLLAPDSAVALSNQVYALFDQGVGRIADREVQIISRPIEGELLRIRGETGNADVAAFTFGLAYESDRKYMLFLKGSDGAQTEADLVYVFNNASVTWTTFDLSCSSAIVGPNDKLVRSFNGSALMRERKNFNDLDITGEDFDLDTTTMTVDGSAVLTGTTTLGATWPKVGDMMYRIGYLSNPRFVGTSVNTGTNQITITNHGLTANQAIRFTSTGALPSGLTAYQTYYADPVTANTFRVLSTPSGAVVSLVTTGTGTHKAHYGAGSSFIYTKVTSVALETVGTLQYVIRTADDIDLKLSSTFPIVKGRRAIDVEIEYNPLSAGQPGILKQWAEALVITRQSFENFDLAFKSGNSLNFETVTFAGDNNGGWGLFPWGEVPWGGETTTLRYRTYVPINKQRDPFLSLRIKQATAGNNFELSGVQLMYRNISSRVVR